MVEKHSRFMCAAGLRALLAVGAISLCGLAHMHAGNSQTNGMEPAQEISAIQYDVQKGSWMLREDFDKNRDFADLLLDAYTKMALFRSALPKITDWRPAAEAYHLAFEELKQQLQGEWRRIFGDGPSRFPWNGHSDGATDLWREDDLRRDMPVVLYLWAKGHICSTSLKWSYYYYWGVTVPNDNKAYVPTNLSVLLHQRTIDKGKDDYRSFVLKFFNAKKLSVCAEYLQKFFCEPVAKLLQGVSPMLEKATNKADLLCLLQLYADYYSLDAVRNHTQEGFVETTRRMVRLMRQCYLNYSQWEKKDKEWLCSLLENLNANYYAKNKESLHTYCIQSHDLWKGFTYVCSKSRWSSEKIFDTGLENTWKRVEDTPLPKATWLKFLDYAGRRLSLYMEELDSILVYHKGGYPDLTLHQKKTFDQVPGVIGAGIDLKKIIPQLEVKDLEKEFENLKKRKQFLDLNYGIFKQEQAEIKKQYEALEKESEDLNVAVNNHKVSEQEKERRVIEIVKQMESLEKQRKDLVAKNEELKQERVKINEQFEDFKKQIDSMSNMSGK